MKNKSLWLILLSIVVVSFSVLLWQGAEIFRYAPPIPEQVVSTDGSVLFTKEDILQGQMVWRSVGGHETGSIWGHGSYVAPDWNADWLHREILHLRDMLAGSRFRRTFDELPLEQQAGLNARVKQELRTNTYDPDTGTITLSQERAQVERTLSRYYQQLFSDYQGLEELREQYAIRNAPVVDPEHRRQLTAFLFWTTWSTATNRPGLNVSYTNNWPHEPLIDNRPATSLLGWSMFSIILLIAGIAAMAWQQALAGKDAPAPQAPRDDPLRLLTPTPSMHACKKYFWTAMALFLLQILMGGITAHYAVEGHAFYGINISDIIPYSITRTWHTQLGLFWIATIWLGTGLYFAPLLSGHEPRFQKPGVDALYVALVIVVLGSMLGEWLGVQQLLSLDTNFWFGHQGYEYIDLGRFWQLLLFAGLLIWLTLVTRALWPALKERHDHHHVVSVFFLSAVAIGLFYGVGLLMGKHTHLSLAEYWRWWVVHLWVEAFFEVFATAVVAILFVRMGLIKAASANNAVLFSTVIFMTGGIIGTLHHLYFGGVPTSVIAWGASFSALEVVPLCLIGVEALHNYRMRFAAPWAERYTWPILFFVATAFWNLVGAGLFGFLINPPISLYYIQGLNTTPLHGHAALFGVYGMLGIGLLLVCLRGLSDHFKHGYWDDRLLRLAFWTLNGGLIAMALTTLLPIGVLQALASMEHGYWYARSAEFIHQPVIHTLTWLRMIGDIIFSVGAGCLALFLFRLSFGHKPEESLA